MNQIPQEVVEHTFLYGILGWTLDHYRDLSDKETLEKLVSVFDTKIGDYSPPFAHSDDFSAKVLETAHALLGLAAEARTVYGSALGDAEKIRHFVSELEKTGFSIEESDGLLKGTTGINSPSIYDLKVNGETQKRFVVKGMRDTARMHREVELSEILNHYGAGNVLVNQHLGLKDGKPYVISSVEPEQTVEEALTSGAHSISSDLDVVESLADFNAGGAYVLKSKIDDFIGYIDDPFPELAVPMHCGSRFGDALTERSKNDRINAVKTINEHLDDFTGSLGRTYASEFARRITRQGGNSEKAGQFLEAFTSKYINPMMESQKVLCHGDFHIGNVFSSGKIFDLESACHGAAGDDLAQYLVSKHTHTGLYSLVDAEAIIRENDALISHYIYVFNKNMDYAEEGSEKTLGETAGIAKIDEAEFRQKMKGMIMHSALTRTMQRLKDYNSTGKEEYKEIAYGNFSIFYSSLDNDESKMFNDAFGMDSSLSEFIERYSQKEIFCQIAA